MKGKVYTLAATAALLVGCSEETAAPVIKHGTAIDHGAAIFTDPDISGTDLNTYSCATCHESGPADTAVVRPGGSLVGVTKRPAYWAGQELDLLRAVNACLYYFMLKDIPFTADDEEARALYAYLDSISQGAEGTSVAPFSVVVNIADLPVGDATRGGVTYGRACKSCHGAAHTAAGRTVERAPVLPEQTLQEHPLGQYTAKEQRLVFVEKTRHGAFITYAGTMPPFSTEKLSDAEMADILQFLSLY